MGDIIARSVVQEYIKKLLSLSLWENKLESKFSIVFPQNPYL